MRIGSPMMTNHLRPVLVADGDSHLVALVRQALDSMSQRQALMVISQPAELRQYLQDTCRMNRSPSVIVLSGRNDAGIALVEWMHAQQNAISKIPIVALGTAPSPLSRHGVAAALESPTAETLVDVLRLVMRGGDPPVT